ncbi:alcohol dehydrogenase catalytic domain-containing protein [Halomicrococcus sp. SG-WS-1]|uniref:alcohol dehydrogenase catalytic domain-containing protein n=1 Tax=Halomicrococcus sp. SG-WS-1 TaxID=3439057 RepID=UPI003F795B50
MRAAVLRDDTRLVVEDRPRPEPSPGDVIVRVEACGVCTTDLHLYEGNIDVETPLVPGHEPAGVVVESRSDAVDENARVAVNPTVPCNACEKCKAGRTNLCASNTSLGGAADTVLDGAFAEYVRVPATNVEPVGDLPFRIAALAEPVACCVHGVDRADVDHGDSAVVFGAGPMGLLFAQTLRNRGASPIAIVEPDQSRRERALGLGADEAIDPTGRDPVAAVRDRFGAVSLAVEAVGHIETIEQAHAVTADGGTTLVFGVPPRDGTIEISPFRLFFDELALVGSYSLTADAFRRAVDLLRTGRIDAGAVVTDECELERITRAFERMDSNRGLRHIVRPRDTK